MVDIDGYAALPFGRDLAGLHEINIYPPGLEALVEYIWIDTRDYNEQHIEGVDSSRVTPPVEVHNRITDESKRIKAARAGVTLHDSWREEVFVWPVFGRLTGRYGSRRVYNGVPKSPHWGVDVAMPKGTPVYAPAGGIIVLAEKDLYFSGGTVILDHGGGLTSSFLHLSKIETKIGNEIVQGQLIARIGSTGRSTGPHLDWRMNMNGERVDSEMWVPPMKSLCVNDIRKMNPSNFPKRPFESFKEIKMLCELPEFLNLNDGQHWLKNMESLLNRQSVSQ